MRPESPSQPVDLEPGELARNLGLDWKGSDWPHLPTAPAPNIVLVADQLDSTQDRLDDVFLRNLPSGVKSLLLVARQQTSGHGRLGRPWFSQGNSALTFTLALPLTRSRPPGHWPLLVGWSNARSLSTWVPFQTLDLKWPNDLLLGGKKVSGSLCSLHQVKGATWIKIGIGVNVGTMAFPAEIAQQATTLADHTDPPPCRDEVLTAIVETLLEDIRGLDGEDLLRHYLGTSSMVRGTEISWEEQGLVHHGKTQGLGSDGSLICEEGGVCRSLLVSEISLLRPRKT